MVKRAKHTEGVLITSAKTKPSAVLLPSDAKLQKFHVGVVPRTLVRKHSATRAGTSLSRNKQRSTGLAADEVAKERASLTIVGSKRKSGNANNIFRFGVRKSTYLYLGS